MIRFLLAFTLPLLVVTSFGQSGKFEHAMKASLTMLDFAKTAEDYTSVAASFERIGDAEKTQWLPYYYASLTTILQGLNNTKANKDELAEKADALIAKAEAVEPQNAEILLFKSMNATIRMLVDPMTRWQQYGPLVAENREKAKQLDPGNPRVYYLEGQNLYGTPKQFGGGKETAKPMFEKSLALFKTFRPAGVLYPNWGQKSTEQMLELCK